MQLTQLKESVSPSNMNSYKQKKYKKLENKSASVNSDEYWLKDVIDFYHEVKNIQIPKKKFDYLKEFYQIEEDLPNDEQIFQIIQSIAQIRSRYQGLKKNWSNNEKTLFLWIIAKMTMIKNHNPKNFEDKEWEYISSMLVRKTHQQCKEKLQSFKKQQDRFTYEEDEVLREIVNDLNLKGFYNKWSMVAKEFNARLPKSYRNSKQCRERWNNHVNPTINKQTWSDEEDIEILTYIAEFGKKWSEVAKKIQYKRSETAIKNRLQTLLRREKKYIIEKIIEKYQNLDPEEVYDEYYKAIGENKTIKHPVIVILLDKLIWRSQFNNKLCQSVNNSLKYVKQETQNSQVQIDFVQKPLNYKIGKIQDLNENQILQLTPCLVDQISHIVYFASKEMIRSLIDNSQNHPQQYFPEQQKEISSMAILQLDNKINQNPYSLKMIEENKSNPINSQSSIQYYYKLDYNENLIEREDIFQKQQQFVNNQQEFQEDEKSKMFQQNQQEPAQPLRQYLDYIQLKQNYEEIQQMKRSLLYKNKTSKTIPISETTFKFLPRSLPLDAVLS